MGKGSGSCGHRAPLQFAAETNTSIVERAHAITIGMAVGDALGATTEFMKPAAIREEHGGLVRDIVGGGVWDVRAGQITDDTEMALGLARSLHLCGGYHPNAALHQYLQWYNGDPAPVDFGATVGYVLNKAQHGYPADWAAKEFHDASGGKSAGNGALMRQAPLAVYYRHDLDALEAAIRADTALTHYDPLAADCGVYFSRQLARLLNDPTAELESSDHPMIQAALNAPRGEIFQRVHQQMGFCLTALAVAAYAVREAPSYEEGMVWVVNMGGDADTNGAIAGALMGAKFGPDAIPQRWRDKLEVGEELNDLTQWSLSGEPGEGNDPFFAQPQPKQQTMEFLPIPNIKDASQEELEKAIGFDKGGLDDWDEDDIASLRSYLEEQLNG